MSTQQTTKVLLIEDNPGDARLIREMLAEIGSALFDFRWTDLLAKGLEHLAQEPADVVLLDLSLPDSQGFETFVKVQASVPQVAIVILTGHNDEALAVETMRMGAQDYLVKGQVDSNLLARAVRYALERKRIEAELRALQKSLAHRVRALEEALAQVKQLQGILPLCSYCKKIRDDRNYWQQVERYIVEHSEARFSHSICPDCYLTVVQPQLAQLKLQSEGK